MNIHNRYEARPPGHRLIDCETKIPFRRRRRRRRRAGQNIGHLVGDWVITVGVLGQPPPLVWLWYLCITVCLMREASPAARRLLVKRAEGSHRFPAGRPPSGVLF